MQPDFLVKTETFEGPLDLLLNLIEKRKLLINDISLSKITDDYIDYINSGENFSIRNRSEFILVASTLLLIKSKSLLPTLELSEDESDSISDLETRLKILKRIKDIEPFVQENFGKSISFIKNKPKSTEQVIFSPGNKINIQYIKDHINFVLKSLPKLEKLPKILVSKVISLEEMIGSLTQRIQKNISMSFKSFAGEKMDKINIVVSFLAMLELVKNGIIVARQEEKFGDINMETSEFGTPNYSN